MNDLQRKLLAAFQVEHKEHLEVARRMLGRLEEAGWTAAAIDLVELYRRIHSLKGAARAVDLRAVETLAHRLENMISACQKGRAALDAASVPVLLRAFDAIEDGVAAITSDGRVELPADVVDAVGALSGSTGESGRSPKPAAPPADAAPTPAGRAAPTAAPPEAGAPTVSDAPNMRVDAGSLDGLFESSVEILAATAMQARLGAEYQALEQEAREARRTIDALRRLELDRPDGSRRSVVDFARARSIQTLEAWVHRFEARTRGFGDAQRSNGRRLSQLGRRLETQVRRLRLVPADTVFGGMRKMVKDLGADHGKPIRLDTRGLDTLADRSVLQWLRDPLMHVLRNAVSHGVETPDTRVAAGKPVEGRIVLDVSARGGRLVVRVEDDGHGIDFERVQEAAAARGMRPAAGGLQADAKALTALLSEPGLSTAEAVTELSGRGIGLSVVATAVAQMLGEFVIGPRHGAGTVVVMSVPIAASSTRVVMVRCRDEVYGVPAHGVLRLHRVPRDRFEAMEGWQVARIDDDGPVRLVALGDLLQGEGHGIVADTPMVPMVLLRSHGARIGLLVDALVAVRDGVVRDLGAAAGDKVAGGMLTENGAIVPVLDVQALVESAGSMAARPILDPAAAATPASRSILVVDDSITTRTLEKSILEANGFRVRLSVDGMDALEQLRDQAADLVISDVEMPRMDGFELLRAIKRDSALAAIPVILVTSRDSAEDRRRGLSLGADAYVVKQRFDQTELLTTIGQLL